MGARLKYALLGVCLASAAGVHAQEATPADPGYQDGGFDDPYASPELSPVNAPTPEATGVDALDLYGFRDAQDVSDDAPAAESTPPPFIPETPVFDGMPEGVNGGVAPEIGQTPQDRIDADALEADMLNALDEGPVPILPDEMEADSEFLGDQGVVMPTQENVAPSIEAEEARTPVVEDGGEAAEDRPEGAEDDQDADAEQEDALQGEQADRVMQSRSGARLRVLDKISGSAQDIEVEVGATVGHLGMEVTVRACYQTPPEELPPESAAYVEVISNRLDKETGMAAEDDPRWFAGWMFASSPGLNAMEHAIYDVWVISCTAS